MQSNDKARRMAASNIPASVMATTLPNEGMDALRVTVAKKEFRTANGLKSYFIDAPSANQKSLNRAAFIAAVFAKELVLSNVAVFFTPLAGLFREMNDAVFWDEEKSRLPKRGDGYVVIPDFDNEAAIPSSAQWAEVQDWLIQHVNRGGGLVLGVSQNTNAETVGTAFSLLSSQFVRVRVSVKG